MHPQRACHSSFDAESFVIWESPIPAKALFKKARVRHREDQVNGATKMKMTTDIPPAITMPDKVDTRLGTLSFKDGFPDDATVQKIYDNLDFQRGT